MVNIYGTLLANIKSKLLKSNRTNAKLKSKLDEVFEINNAEFKKMSRMYGGDKSTLFDRLDYEDKKVEDYKKLNYGGNYAKTNG